jgi:hypothetical protein
MSMTIMEAQGCPIDRGTVEDCIECSQYGKTCDGKQDPDWWLEDEE